MSYKIKHDFSFHFHCVSYVYYVYLFISTDSKQIRVIMNNNYVFKIYVSNRVHSYQIIYVLTQDTESGRVKNI